LNGINQYSRPSPTITIRMNPNSLSESLHSHTIALWIANYRYASLTLDLFRFQSQSISFSLSLSVPFWSSLSPKSKLTLRSQIEAHSPFHFTLRFVSLSVPNRSFVSLSLNPNRNSVLWIEALSSCSLSVMFWFPLINLFMMNGHIQIDFSVNFNFAEFWKIFSAREYCWKRFFASWIW
jgi:hypothetical protein